MALSNEQTKSIKTILTQYSSEVSQVALYPWDSSFCKEEVERLYNRMTKALVNLNIDFHSLTEPNYILLGFQQFENKWLIPLYLAKVIPANTQVVSIMNNVCLASEMDLDNRAGMLAYSIK